MHEELLSRTSEPMEAPISLDEAKAQARVEIDDDDALIEGFISAATEHAEWFTQRALVTQEWEWRLSCFPPGRILKLPKPPLQEVTEITYVDSKGDEQTWDPDDYRVLAPSGPHAGRGQLILKSARRWPFTRTSEPLGIIVRFTAGYGMAAAVPQEIRSAIAMHVADLYENRESTEVPPGVESQLWPFKIDKFGLL